MSYEEKLSCRNGQHLHITREVGIVQHGNIHRERRKDQHPLLVLLLLLMLSNMLTSAESAEWINPLLLVLLLLLAEVAAPASPRLQVQQTQRGRHTGQGQRQLSRLGNRRPHRASLHLPLGKDGDWGRLVRENVPETGANALPRFQGTATVSSMQGSPCACRSRPGPTS